MEIENKIYNYYDEILKEYVPGLKLSDLNFLYKYVTLDEYFSKEEMLELLLLSNNNPTKTSITKEKARVRYSIRL